MSENQVEPIVTKKKHRLLNAFLILLSSLILGVIAIAIVFAYYPGPFLVTFFKIDNTPVSQPGLYKIPVVNDLTGSDFTDGPIYTTSALRFVSPWGEYTDKDERDGSVTYKFQNSRVLFIFGEPRPNMVSVLRAEKSEKDIQTMKLMFGEEALQSDYSITKTFLYTTAQNLNMFDPRAKVVGDIIFLTFKGMSAANTSDKDGEILDFTTNKVKGFQYSTAKEIKQVEIALYPRDENNVSYTLYVKGTQDEINKLLSSVSFVTK